MDKRTRTIGATAMLLLVLMIPAGASRADRQPGAIRADRQTSAPDSVGMLIRLQGGVLCDEAAHIKQIISQFQARPLQDVLIALNKSTGKSSCGMVRRPTLFYMEPVQLVKAGNNKFLIIKLTSFRGFVQYAWRPMGAAKKDDNEQSV